MDERLNILLLLSLCAPFIGEMISGSSPPHEFFNPIAFLFLWGLYGSGVVLMRELWVKWGSGYGRLMILGGIYGIIEEGLAVKSFFDPEWEDLGVLAVYGRYMEVNFVWSVWLSIFHAVFSITIPILIIHSLYPHWINTRLLTEKGLQNICIVFSVTCTLIFFLLNSYVPPPIQYLLCCLLVILLFKVAKEGVSTNLPIPKWLRGYPILSGISFTGAMFICFFIIPETPLPWFIPCIIAIVLLIQLYQKMSDYSKKQILGLCIGLLIPFLFFFDVILEINGNRGMAIVGGLTFISLVWLYKKIK